MGETGLLHNLRMGIASAIAPRVRNPQREIWPYGDGSYSGTRLRLWRAMPELRLDPFGLALAAETSVWADACIQLRMSAVSRMPWAIYDADGNKLDNTPFHAMQKYARLAYQQNLFALWEQSLSVHGESYFEKLYNYSLAQPAEDWGQSRNSQPLSLGRPEMVIPGGLRVLNAIAVRPQVQSGHIVWYQYNASGGKYRLEVADLFVHRYASLTDDYRASAPMIRAMDGIGIKRNMQNFLRGHYDNDATPGGIITPKAGVTAGKDWVDKIMTMWANAFKGANNANSTAIIPAEVDYKQFDRKMPEHQQALSDDQIQEICAAFRVPVDMVKTAASKDPLGGGGKMDSARAMFYQDFVEPECEDIDTYINDIILPWLMPNSGAKFSFDYDETRSLINDTKERSDKVINEFNNSVISYNEMRIALDYEPLPGGDVIKFASGVILVSKDALVTAPALLAPPPPPMPPAPPMLPTPPVTPLLPPIVPQPGPNTKSAAVMLNIGNHPDLVGLQNKTRAYVGDTPVKWSDPGDFHVTLASMPVVDDAQIKALQTALADVEVPSMNLKVGSLNTFDNLDSHAVHFRVRKSVDLLDLQETLHDLINGLGIPLSSFSAPEAYKPHITMGYADSKPPARTFDSHLTVSPTALHLGVGDEVVYQKPIGDVITPEPPTPTSNQPPKVEKPIGPPPAKKSEPELKPVAIYADSALDELAQWEKKVKNKGVKAALAFQNYLIRNEVAEGLRALLAVPEADTKAIFDAVRQALSIKAIQATRLDFENAFEDLLKAALADDVSRRKFGAGLKQLIKVYGFKAFVDGLRDGGIDDDPSDDEQTVIDSMVSEQNAYVSGLGEAIYKDETVSEVMASGKPAMWFGKSIEPFYNKALTMANGNQLLEMTGDDGVKSCFQCSTLKGQRHRARDWEAKKLWPKQDTESYDCGGFECVHQLTPASGKARGNWLGAAKSEGNPIVPPVPPPPPQPAQPVPPDRSERFQFTGYEIVNEGDESQKKYNPSQPRAADGEWGSGGAGGGTSSGDGQGGDNKPKDEKKKKPKQNPANAPVDEKPRNYQNFGQYDEHMVSDNFANGVAKPTDEQAAGMEYYRDIHGNYALNSNLRTGQVLTGDTATHAKHLDSVLANSTLEHDTKVYRGLSNGSPQMKDFEAQIQSGALKPGAVLHDKGYASTTLDSNIAGGKFDGSKGGVVFEIDAPKGSNGLYMNAAMDKYSGSRYNGEFRDEKEVLLPRDSNFKISSIEKVGTGYKVNMTYVSAQPQALQFAA